MSSSLFKTCEKRLRYTEKDDQRIDALLSTGKVARYKTEVIHDAMRLGLLELEQRYLKHEKSQDAGEVLHHA